MILQHHSGYNNHMKILLNNIMRTKKLTARQVERMTGVSKSTINRIAANQLMPRIDTLEEIAKGLNVKISDLYESEYK